MSVRTFQVSNPLMQGAAIRRWQITVSKEFKHLKIDCPIKVDGFYGTHTRTYTAALLRARGINAEKAMAKGVTPELCREGSEA